jgi:hypothetical protein
MGQIVTLRRASDEKYDEVKNTKLNTRYPYLELDGDNGQPEIVGLPSYAPPRTLKTHMPFRLIRRWIEEDKVKTIITSRNPKDTLVSLFHFYKQIPEYQFEDKSWDEFFEHVQAGLQEHGDQYEWLLDWCNNKDKGEILFVAYEDLKSDPVSEIQKIAAFLNVDLSAERLNKILHDTNITQMKNSSLMRSESWMTEKTQFIRSGQSGGWRKYFTDEQSQWYDTKYKHLYEALPIGAHYQ